MGDGNLLGPIANIFQLRFFSSLGAAGIVFGLPVLMNLLYFTCNDVTGCPVPALLEPKTLTWEKLKAQIPWPENGIWGFISWEVTGWVMAYYLLSLVLYRVLPAQETYGTKLRETGRPLKYRFNGMEKKTSSQEEFDGVLS